MMLLCAEMLDASFSQTDDSANYNPTFNSIHHGEEGAPPTHTLTTFKVWYHGTYLIECRGSIICCATSVALNTIYSRTT